MEPNMISEADIDRIDISNGSGDTPTTQEVDEENKKIIRKTALKAYSTMGFAVFIFGIVEIAASVLFQLGISPFLKDKLSGEIIKYVFGIIIPIYCIALPVFYMIAKRIRPQESHKEKMSFGKLLGFWAMCMPVMYLGNIIGTVLSRVINQDSVNSIEVLLQESSLIQVVTVCILGPIVEEFVFRKTIIDRTRRYGEKYAIFFSALLFGLFHFNFFQFFYAFGLGAVFGYIYIKSGKIQYTMGLHMLINFMGSVLAQKLIKAEEIIGGTQELARLSDDQMRNLLSDPQKALAFGYITLYSIMVLILVISGIVLWIVNLHRKSLKCNETYEYKFAMQKMGLKLFVNFGTVMFYLLAVIMFISALFFK